MHALPFDNVRTLQSTNLLKDFISELKYVDGMYM